MVVLCIFQQWSRPMWTGCCPSSFALFSETEKGSMANRARSTQVSPLEVLTLRFIFWHFNYENIIMFPSRQINLMTGTRRPPSAFNPLSSGFLMHFSKHHIQVQRHVTSRLTQPFNCSALHPLLLHSFQFFQGVNVFLCAETIYPSQRQPWWGFTRHMKNNF